jgi:DNA-binding protein HU-beta
MGIALLAAATGPAGAAPCRDAHGRFAKCSAVGATTTAAPKATKAAKATKVASARPAKAKTKVAAAATVAKPASAAKTHASKTSGTTPAA